MTVLAEEVTMDIFSFYANHPMFLGVVVLASSPMISSFIHLLVGCMSNRS
jgi:hypothetical protein